MSLALDKSYEDALRFFAQGNYNQAIRCFRQYDPKGSNPEIVKQIRHCLISLARKLWKQNKTEEFSKIISELNSHEFMSLALARLRGNNALSAFAETKQDLDGLLATCFLQQDVKSGLLMLRKSPEMKYIAEGWIALIKDDNQRAVELFAQGKLTAPKQADVGTGVALVCKGNYLEADKYLDCLRPFAGRCFPLLSKIMGWQNSDEIQINEMSNINIHLPLDALLALEKTIPNTRKSALALVVLRIGDHFALNGKKEALSYWSRAESLDPKLKLDVLKRRFQAAISDRCDFDIMPSKAFILFYNQLKKHSEADAADFIHYLVFDSLSSVCSLLDFEDLLNEYKPLTANLASPQIKLLCLSLFCDQILSKLKKVNVPEENTERALINTTWSGWLKFFEVLDPLYSMKEHYLNCKLSMAQVLKEHDAVRQIAYALLCLNPHLVEEILPIYISASIPAEHLSIKEFHQNAARHAEIIGEIRVLRSFFPRNFDLLRLSKIGDAEKSEKQLDSFEKQLSEPLYEVLKLQFAIDRGDSLPKIKKIVPKSSLLNISKEADWRLFAALSSKRFNYPKKTLLELLQRVAPDSTTKHEFFIKMRQHGYGLPASSIIQQWMKKDKLDWQPYYHMMHYYHSEKKYLEFGKMLMETDRRIPKNAREYMEVQCTLAYIEEHNPELLMLNTSSNFDMIRMMINQLMGG